ncbi:MAG: hypothetical protein KDC71_20220 [Acidobacteria bacterium]|nr:hypothetical protein [Acidobacteriota bacterium]
MKKNNYLLILLASLAGLSLMAQTRIIPHVTRPGGGFETQFILENRGTATALNLLNIFNSSGQALGTFDMFILPGTHVLVNASEYGPDVSHLTIDGDAEIFVTAVYRASKNENSPAHIPESRTQSTLWRIFASNWNLTFDGLAIVNTGTAKTNVQLVQKNEMGLVIAQTKIIDQLAPMAKGLYVLAAPFTASDGSSFEIVADQPIAVTALRGSYPSDPVGYLWENNALPAVSKAQPADGFSLPHVGTYNHAGYVLQLTQEGQNASTARFDLNNPSGNGNALYMASNAAGPVLQSASFGNAPAALLQGKNTTSDQPILSVVNEGHGNSAFLANTNASADQSTLEISNEGKGSGIEMENTNKDGTLATWVNRSTDSNLPQFVIQNQGKSNTTRILTTNTQNQVPALDVYHQGLGSAASFHTFESANDQPTVITVSRGSGSALKAESLNGSTAIEGYGNRSLGGYFEQTNAESNSAALVARNQGNGFAAVFHGDVYVNGNLSKNAGTFVIDHPLDPENKYLYHSFVESDQMMNLYSGTVQLDAEGQAVVKLPDWFEALNTDISYQLTAVGKPGPGLYVARELADGSFAIAGGQPQAKVSWQLTGVRQDAYARQNPLIVEKEKQGEEKGKLLNPQAFGKTENEAIRFSDRSR